MPAAANKYETEKLSDAKLVAEAQAQRSAEVGTGTKVAAGTMWVMLQTVITKGVMVVGQLVLAGLLQTEDFGEIGLAYTVTAFVTLITNPGVDLILLRRGKRFDLWSAPAFYFTLFTGILGSVIIVVAAPLVAHIYESPRVVGLLVVLALATPLGSLLIVPTAKLQTELNFKTASAIALAQSVLQTALTIVFAALGAGVYAFVLPVPFVYLAIAILLWRIVRPSIRSRDCFRHWKYLIGDSSYIFGQRLLVTIVMQSDNVILGALYGAAVVGPYFFAYGVATQAIRLTAGSLQLVLMAGLARMPAFSTQQTQAALRATRAIALCGMPLCMLQAALAGPLLHALYGDKWNEAIPLIQLLSIGLAFDVITWPACSLLQSRGKFRFLFFWSCLCATIFIVAIVVGAYIGKAHGVALAVCLFYALLSPPFGSWILWNSSVPARDIVEVYVRSLIVALIALGATIGTIGLSANLPSFLQVGFSGGVGLVATLVAARTIAPASWNDIWTKLVSIFPSLALNRK